MGRRRTSDATSKECLKCGKTFSGKYPAWIRFRKFCSQACSGKFSRPGFGKLEAKKLNPTLGVCRFCKGKIEKRYTESMAAYARRRFCSLKCAHSATGPDTCGWKGGRQTIVSQGRRVVVLQVNGRRLLEHRIIAEKAVGRPLQVQEVVHHINGQSDDNRSQNLLVCNRGYHKWLHEEMSRRYMKEHFS